MLSTRATIANSKALAARLREAIESERFEEALSLLAEYSECLTALCESGDYPSQPQVMEFMDWALRSVTAARAHASDQFQLLSDSLVYAASNRDRKTWQMML